MLKIIDTNTLTKTKVWANSITAKYAREVESVIDTGRELIAAKADLPHGEFQKMVRSELPFKERAAQMYMAVATNTRLLDPDIRPRLPNTLTTLYTLSKIDPDVFDAMLTANEINPERSNQDIALCADLYKVRTRGEREAPRPKPFAKVLSFPTKEKADQLKSAAMEGEFIPATREIKPQQKLREGLTIDVGVTEGPRKYQNSDQLLKAARRMLGAITDGKTINPVEALEWVSVYDCFRVEETIFASGRK